MFYIQQTHENGCGIACLKMVLSNIRKDKRYLFLNESEEKQSSYKEIIALAKSHGLFLCGFRVNRKDELLKQRIFPVIVTIVPEEGVNHSVVITKINRFYVKILDPEKGQIYMKTSKFMSIWDGTGLLIEKDEGGTFPYEVDEPNKFTQTILSVVFQFISGISFILGVYFINDKTHIAVPLAFLFSFIIFELINKAILFKTMENIDEFYSKDCSVKKDDYKSFLVRLEDYKELSLVTPINFVTKLIVAAFLIFILIINGINNLVLVLLPFGLAVLDGCVVQQLRKNKEKEIEQKEKKLYQIDDQDEFVTELDKIHKQSYSLAKTELFKRYLYILLMIMMSLFVIFIAKEIKLVQGAFYFFIQYVLFDYLVAIFSFSDKRNEFNLAKAKLMNIIHKDENV